MTMKARALTLLESLLALVLLLALGAIIVPSIVRSLEERTFDQAADVTSEQLMLARAHAQATGEPVEVTYRADTAKVEARKFSASFASLDLDSIGIVSAAPVSVVRPRQTKPARNESSEDGGQIFESWATRSLAKGMRILSHMPPAESSDSAAERSTNQADPSADQSLEEMIQGEDIRLAVFLPDGSALASGPVWLGDDAGRWGMLTVNPWSGLPVFRRLSAAIDPMGEVSQSESDETEVAEVEKPRNAKSQPVKAPRELEPQDDGPSPP